MKRALLAILGIAVILSPCTRVMAAPTTAYAQDVVQTDHQEYSYKEMMNDLEMLKAKYPMYLSYESVGKTAQDREIVKVILGNPDAPKKVMVQSSMHGREYMASQLTMEMIEYICSNMSSLSYEGIPYRELFDNVCFVIMPMVNPDGVMLSQKGMGSLRRLTDMDWFGAKDIEQVKSNANGVDINRNFPYGFGGGRDAADEAGLEFYCGERPVSEAETRALIAVSGSEDFSCHINYHTAGEAMYYSDVLTKEDAAEKSALLVDVLHDSNGYLPLLDSGWEEGPTGCFSDWVTRTYQRPTVTVELGTKNPVPVNEFEDIFEKNKDTWGSVAYLLYSNQL